MKERTIFLAALDEGTPAQRSAYLDEACGGDAALRRRVEGLLASHEQAGSFLAKPVPQRLAEVGGDTRGESPVPQPGATLDEPVRERPGAVVGPYKLMEQIGEGGMGLVFVAEQQHPVRRKVAVKVIKPGMDTREVIARFEAERQALALMDHPNIARVFDAGATDSGRPYFVMELVRGVGITQFCDENRLSPRERLELFVHVCQAVQHAHQKGIIHRDLKATNILVTLHDGTPVVKVIDFGVAKAVGQQLTDKTIYTSFAQMIGTPTYMSPEQAEMSGLDVDTRSDVYSLGVLLYELLTGATPFDRERLKTASYDEIRRIVREEEPPRPSQRISTLLADTLTVVSAQRKTEPRRLSQLFRGELDWIVMKALEKDRNRRYETASAFAADVQRYLKDEQVLACPPSSVYRLRKFVRRNKGPVLTASVVVLALVGGIIGTTWGMLRATNAEADAVNEAKQKELALKDKEIALTAARRAERERTDQLWRSHRDRARALRFGGQAGQRFDSLKALAEATRIARTLEVGDEEILKLRNEAVACLALADLRFERMLVANVQYYWTAFDPDFRYFVWSDLEGNVRIHRVSDGEETARLPRPDARPTWMRLGFSPDGRRLAVSFDLPGQTEFHVWEFADGKAARPVVLPWATAARLDFSPDSRLLAVRRKDKNGRTIGVYEAATGREVKRLPFAGSHVAFHPDGRHLGFSTMGDRFVRVVGVETGEEVARYEHPEVPGFVAWRRDGRLLAVGCNDQRIYVWDHAQGRMQSVLEGHTSGGELVFKFSHGGDFLISTSWDNTTRLWDPVTGRQLVVLGGHHFVDVRRDDKQVALVRFGEQRNDLGLWDVAGGWECRTLHHGLVGNRTPRPASWGPAGIDFSPDGRLLASASRDGATRLWDLATFTEAGHLPSSWRNEAVLFHPDGNGLFTYGPSGLHRWPIRRETRRAVDQAEEINFLQAGPPERLDVSGNSVHPAIGLDAKGRRLAAIDYPRGRTILLNLEDLDKKLVLLHPKGVSALSPDGRWVVSWGGIEQTKIWDSSDGKLAWELPAGHAFAFFTPDGRWLVTSPPGAEPLRFWELGSWQAGRTLPKPAANHPGLLPSPDGKLLLLHSLTPRLLHGGTGRELAALKAPHDNGVTCSRFSPDGIRLAIATDNHTVHVWDLRATRRGLAEIGLDWDLPAYPPATPRRDARPLRVEVEAAKVPPKAEKGPPLKK